MESIPRIIIIAEHNSCSDTKHWFSLLHLFAKNLEFFPNTMLQIRSKTRPDLRSIAAKELPPHPQIAINSSISEYEKNDVDFLHLPQKEAPQHLLSFPFGLSIHHHTDPHHYDEFNPNYYQLGPIFSPISKKGIPQGISLIERTAKETQTPIIAVGGIHPHNINEVLSAGAFGVASSGYLMQAAKPITALETLYSTMEKYIQRYE
jgi:thiamine monophosphate synthase